MRPSRSHYDFTGLSNSDPKIHEICAWEYARECKSLIAAMQEFKARVSKVSGVIEPERLALRAYSFTPGARYVEIFETSAENHLLNDGWVAEIEEAASAITRIVPRLDWGLFCSHEFPERPWLKPGSTCPIRQFHRILRHLPIVHRLNDKLGKKFPPNPEHPHLDNRERFPRTPELPRLQFEDFDIESDPTWEEELINDIRGIRAPVQPPRKTKQPLPHCPSAVNFLWSQTS